MTHFRYSFNPYTYNSFATLYSHVPFQSSDGSLTLNEPSNHHPHPNQPELGSLGLGTALAVAYGLCGESTTTSTGQPIIQQSPSSLPPFNASFYLTPTLPINNQQQFANFLSSRKVLVSPNHQQQLVATTNTTTTNALTYYRRSNEGTLSLSMPSLSENSGLLLSQPQLDAYLTPIAINGHQQSKDAEQPPSSSNLPVTPTLASSSNTNMLFVGSNSMPTNTNHHQQNNGFNQQQPQQKQHELTVPLNNLQALPSVDDANLRQLQQQNQQQQTALFIQQQIDQASLADPPIDLNSTDESLYEVTEEEAKEIDATLYGNPDIMASRQWKYYIETNEWTRATCALMACLFSRGQMANSTVLGRGGSRRAKLPSNLVAYVVSTIRRRFNKPAAAIRARMAQKCKDERRFVRIIALEPNGLPDFASTSPVAALTVKHPNCASNVSSASRRRPSRRSDRSRKRPSTVSSIDNAGVGKIPRTDNGDAMFDQYDAANAGYQCQLSDDQLALLAGASSTSSASSYFLSQQLNSSTANMSCLPGNTPSNNVEAASSTESTSFVDSKTANFSLTVLPPPLTGGSQHLQPIATDPLPPNVNGEDYDEDEEELHDEGTSLGSTSFSSSSGLLHSTSPTSS